MSIGFTICLVVTRAIHFGASLLMLGVWMFDLIARDVLDEFASIWRQLAKRLIWIAIWAVMVSGVAWFVQVTMNMSGVGFGEAIHPSVLHLVWSETQFGQVWKWRAIFWIFCVFVSYRKTEAATFGSPFVERGDAGVAATFRIIRAIAGILLVASLAWSGHGQTGFARPWHLSADILHLLICSIWPIGLLPFVWLIAQMRRASSARCIAQLTHRFSAVSLVSVALLATTGLINSWSLLGSFGALFSTTYGRILLLKVAMFATMVGLGAANMLYLKPRLASRDSTIGIDAKNLQRNASIELAIGMLILIVVGLLGTLPPADL